MVVSTGSLAYGVSFIFVRVYEDLKNGSRSLVEVVSGLGCLGAQAIFVEEKQK